MGILVKNLIHSQEHQNFKNIDKNIIFNAMINSQFSCFPLIWMFMKMQQPEKKFMKDLAAK